MRAMSWLGIGVGLACEPEPRGTDVQTTRAISDPFGQCQVESFAFLVRNRVARHLHWQTTTLANEGVDELIGGIVEDVFWRVDLLDPAAIHHRHAARHGHGLALVMSHIDGAELEFVVQPLDLGAQLQSQRQVKCRERFIK